LRGSEHRKSKPASIAHSGEIFLLKDVAQTREREQVMGVAAFAAPARGQDNQGRKTLKFQIASIETA